MGDKKINTHGMVMDKGKHRGELYTRIPIGYLKWMINVGHSNADIAAAELDRRGTVIDHDFIISNHAIDRVSLRCMGLWEEDREKDEGLYSWLARVVGECVRLIDKDKAGVVKMRYKGMKLVFDIEGVWPVLKTVMKAGGGTKDSEEK